MNTKGPIEQLAQYFGDVDVEVLRHAIHALEHATGKTDVVERLVDDVQESQQHLLSNLGLSMDLSRDALRSALNAHLDEEDRALRDLMFQGSGSVEDSLTTMRNIALEMAHPDPVWVLRWDRARRILEEHPPPALLKYFGSRDIDALLEQEDIKQVFAALRFTESTEWMHETFDAAYKDLTPADFEERPLEAIVLGPEWVKPARHFVEKKHHNLSHLKELGVVFIIPVSLEGTGMFLRVMAILIHYMHEVSFYSKIFQHIAKGDSFSDHFISLLRGDVPEASAYDDPNKWLVVQRYLVKEDPNDARLGLPHVNPEALHYARAAKNYVQLGKRFDDLDVEHWDIGSHTALLHDDGPQSLDLIDNIMSLADSNKGVEYSYHQHEALWNELFARFMGEETLEEMMIKHLFDGIIEIRSQK